MSAALSTLILVLVGHFAWEGALIDLGPESAGLSAIALLLGAGLGLRSSARLPYLTELVGLALLLPLRGPLCDALYAVLPARGVAPVAAALLTLAPLGFILGKQLILVTRTSLLPPVVGFCVGEALVLLGAVGVMPGLFTGLVAAGLLAALGETAQPAGPSGTPSGRGGWQAAFAGLALGLAAISLRRIIGAYHEPLTGGPLTVWIALLAPAVLVAWPLSVLATPGWPRRIFGLAAGVALGWALVASVDGLGMYMTPGRHVMTSRDLHGLALEYPWVGEWWIWLLAMGGLATAASGGVLGTLGARSLSGLVLGVAAGLALGEVTMDAEPSLLQDLTGGAPWMGPMSLLLVASGAGLASGAAAVLGRWGPVAAVLVVVPFVLVPEEQRYPFESVRRIGEPSVDAMVRQRRADVVAYSTFGPDVSSPEGVGRYYTTFTGRGPRWLPEEILDADLLGMRHEDGEGDIGSAGGAAGGDAAVDPVDPHAGHDHGSGDVDAEALAAERRYGLRVAGITAHADHTPTGPEGSMSRLTRLFAPAGRALVVGIGGELLAADLAAAGLTDSVDVATEVPLGFFPNVVLMDALGLDGFPGGADDRPGARLREADGGAYASVLVAPGRGEWAGVAAHLASESLERARRLLRDDGRCLAWIDTTGMSPRVLRSRLAAFGGVFGERSAAFVEMRGLDAPFLLMVGWVSDAGRPRRAALGERLPAPDRDGFRTPLHHFHHLRALLVRDGAGMARAADEWPRHRRSRPVPFVPARGGWASVAEVFDREARLGDVVEDLSYPLRGGWPEGLMDGLVEHGRYELELWRRRSHIIEVVDDVDWDAFARESQHYAAAAALDREHPVLMHAVAALCEPLVAEGDYTRFVDVYQAVGGERMPHWRLAMLEAIAARQLLDPERAVSAALRAQSLRSPDASLDSQPPEGG